MSWWNTNSDNDIIGDVPADIIGNTFKTIVKDRSTQGKPKPTLQEIVDSVAVALHTEPETFIVGSNKTFFHKVVVILESGSNQESSKDYSRANSYLVTMFLEAFQAIAHAYEERWERKPRLRELLACITFVLGFQPEEFISDAKKMHIKDLIIQ
jgi:hypothetical protein